MSASPALEAQLIARVRPACPDDAARIAVLCDQLGYPTTTDVIRERMAEIAREKCHAIFVAEETSGLVVGWIHIYVCPQLEVERQAEIGGLGVDEGWRSHGIGRALLDQAEQWARQRGVSQLIVRSNIARKRAHAFYERAGYVCFKTSRVFFKTLPSS
ncbi:MAG: GNAT family N-acetyltransferase [Anaerolineae bacterium]|nr:GNAT family N-acetyltransferase [Anaerolineae bacterium]